MLTHHHRKSGGAHGNEMLGSQAIFGSVDNAVFLYRDGDRRFMRTQVRIGEDMARTEIRLDANGWVHLAGAGAPGARADDRSRHHHRARRFAGPVDGLG